MKSLLAAVLVAAAAASPTASQAPPPKGHEATSAGEGASGVLRLEDEFARGVVRRDAAALQGLLAEGFVYTENDATTTRDALVNDLTAGADVVEAATNRDMVVHPFGDAALVTGWLVIRGHGNGGRFERRYRFTDTWQLRDGRWQLIGAHDYLAPAGAR